MNFVSAVYARMSTNNNQREWIIIAGAHMVGPRSGETKIKKINYWNFSGKRTGIISIFFKPFLMYICQI